MKTHLPALGMILIAMLAFSPAARAQQDQAAVIGFGLGIHSFSETDDVRQQFFLTNQDVGGMLQFYGEWYPLGRLGFGIRSLFVGLSETVIITPPGIEVKTDVDVSTLLLTIHFIPFISGDGYFRVGLLGGAGGAKYELSQTVLNTTASIETSGTAALAGAYIDWGGDVFGARFGVHVLSTDFDPLQNPPGPDLNVDGSGTSFYVDLRWAFE